MELNSSKILNTVVSTSTVDTTQPLETVDTIVAKRRPSTVTLCCFRPLTLKATAIKFTQTFPGRVLYAVKVNPDPIIIRNLWEGGICAFDCASQNEIKLIRTLLPTSAKIYYMHPVKSEQSIREAYYSYNVTDFSLDTIKECHKILSVVVEKENNLGLYVRLALSSTPGGAMVDLSAKFGAEMQEAVEILRYARPFVKKLGICFHVGSQCMNPLMYKNALDLCRIVIEEADVSIDIIDVGGGFPMSYPDITPPSLDMYFAAIKEGIQDLQSKHQIELLCEPGRALVAASMSLIVKVEDRRDHILHITDGMHGNLYDAGVFKWRYPTRLIRLNGVSEPSSNIENFSFFGPTCNSRDFMPGPFLLPADVATNDWIEIGQTGSYTTSLRSQFNGFHDTEIVEVSDPPLIQTPGH